MHLFVGGYYDDRIFEGDYFDGKTPFSKDIKCYSMEEVLKLGFVEPVIEYFEENTGKDWILDATIDEKINAIMQYTDSDEIAGLVYFDNESDAEKYIECTLSEIRDCEANSEYYRQIQDDYGCFRDVYVFKPEC